MKEQILKEIKNKYSEYLEMGEAFSSALVIKILLCKLEEEMNNRIYLERRLKSCEKLLKEVEKHVSTNTTNK